MSEWVLKRDKDIRIGVLQGEELNDSDHRQLLVELDCQVLLGLDEEGCKEPAPLPKWVQPKLYLSDDKMVLDYAKEVNRLGEERGCEAAVEELEQAAVEWSGHEPDLEESPVLQALMDAVMARCLGVLLDAERPVVGKPKVQRKAILAVSLFVAALNPSCPRYCFFASLQLSSRYLLMRCVGHLFTACLLVAFGILV